MTDDTSLAPADLDSESCLCVVASYVNAAGRVGSVTAEAARRIMLSPVTGDFIELRFASLGPQPGLAGDIADVARPISDVIASPRQVSGRNYFALVVVDRSAAAVEQVLRTCATAPFLGDLRLRLLGIASVDDRRSSDRDHDRDPALHIVVSPSGAWRHESDLVDVLHGFGEDLLRHFATSRQGLTPEDFAALAARHAQLSAVQPGRGQQLAQDSAPPPDVLAEDAAALAEVRPDHEDRVEQDGTRPAGTASGDQGKELAGSAAAEPGANRREPGSPVPAPLAATLPQDQEHGGGYKRAGVKRTFRSLPKPAGRLQRLLPAGWRGNGKPKDATDLLVARQRVSALLYLLITGDGAGDQAAWNRSRDTMLEVDRKVAETAGITCKIRALHGNEHILRGELRAAGHLSRRSIKGVADADFAVVLEKIRVLLRLDQTEMTRPPGADIQRAVVLFAPEPPLADSVTKEVFAELAAEAMVTWVVPKASEGLVAPAFRDLVGVRVVTDHETAPGEIAAQLAATPATAEPELEPAVGTDA